MKNITGLRRQLWIIVKSLLMTTDTPTHLGGTRGPLKYKKDSNKEDILTDDTGNHQVMMEWEKLYMDTLVQKLNPSGDVLEIGFGLGYSATAIQRYNIKSHTIIEADPEVLKRLRIWADEQKHPVNIIEGSWQKKLPKVTARFDSFFLDDYPTVEYPDPYDTRVLEFYNLIMKNNVKKNSRFTWFCGKPLIVWPCFNWTKWECEEYNINIPSRATYLNSNDKLYLPLITFTENSPLGIPPSTLIFEMYDAF